MRSLTRPNSPRSTCHVQTFPTPVFARANLTSCRVYGVSAWDLHLEGAIQDTLIVTAVEDENQISVDNLELAQFVYLLLNNQNIQAIQTAARC